MIQASTGYPNEANGRNRVRLYQHGVHVGVRVAHGLVLVVYVAGLVGLAFSFPSRLEWRDALALVMLLIFPWFAAIVFRTRRVFGSALGLEYNRGREWRTVPWSEVEPPEYTWWSVGRPGRIAAVRIRGEEKAISFFASDRILSDLTRMRATAAPGSQGSAKAPQ